MSRAGRSAANRRRAIGAVGITGLLALSGQHPALAMVAPIVPDPAELSAGSAQLGTAPAQPDPAGQPADPAQAQAASPQTAPDTSGADDPGAIAQSGGIELWTTLRATAQDALNAHTSDLSAAQLLAALGSPGTLTVNLRVDPSAAIPGTSVLDSAWVSCPHRTWCGNGQVVAIAGLGSAQGQDHWSDYTGTVLDRTQLGSPGRPPITDVPGNALHVVADPTIPAGTAGATTWAAQLWPTFTDPDRLPRPGQPVKVHYRRAADGQEGVVAVTMPAFPISVPVVNAATVGTISADTLTTGPDGQLAVNLWRPQRLADTAGEPVTDLSGLDYGLLLSDGTSTISCAPRRYSDGVGLSVPPELSQETASAANALPLRDGAPVDLEVSQSRPIGFTVDVAGCLADATAQGVTLGSALQVTLVAGSSNAASATSDVLGSPGSATAGTTYRLVVAGR